MEKVIVYNGSQISFFVDMNAMAIINPSEYMHKVSVRLGFPDGGGRYIYAETLVSEDDLKNTLEAMELKAKEYIDDRNNADGTSTVRTLKSMGFKHR